MKFKNYVNPKTNDSLIYSLSNLLDMPLREIFSRKGELTAQHKILGLPKDEELKNSDNVVHVEAYTREDGTEVKAHWRSKPGSGSVTENSQNKNNKNNESNVNDTQSDSSNVQIFEETEEYKKEYRELENQKSIERNDPEEIAGVKRGEPMTFEEMVKKGVNPSFENDNEDSGNCQGCVGAAEMCRRGYDVVAKSRENNPLAEELAYDGFGLWLDPKTGEKCEPYEFDLSTENCFEYMDKNVNIGERYAFAYYNEMSSDYIENGANGHVITIEKNDKGEVRIYDPQIGRICEGNDAKLYINSWTDERSQIPQNPAILRIDNKKVNPRYSGSIFRPRF